MRERAVCVRQDQRSIFELKYHVYNGYTLYVVQSQRHDFIFIASLYSTPTYCSLILI